MVYQDDRISIKELSAMAGRRTAAPQRSNVFHVQFRPEIGLGHWLERFAAAYGTTVNDAARRLVQAARFDLTSSDFPALDLYARECRLDFGAACPAVRQLIDTVEAQGFSSGRGPMSAQERLEVVREVVRRLKEKEEAYFTVPEEERRVQQIYEAESGS
jgi:hypothetical protein